MSNVQSLTDKEQYKFEVVSLAIEKKIRNRQAAKMLGLSIRQVKRLKNSVRKNGEVGIIHRLKGKTGNNRIQETVKQKALQYIKEKYLDFKPTFANEKLQDSHNIFISPETIRLWMIKEGLWTARKQKDLLYRSWRPRKEYYGEMQQFDGSYHDWFEGRFRDLVGNIIETCLLLSVDDATGKITSAMFADNEGVVAVFSFWLTYVTVNGKPITIYLDSYSTYKINHKSAVDNFELMTQFERATKDLGVRLITAHSAQAKGRIERLFETLQDRLIKEMRLAGINNPEDANKFLKEVFIPKYNQKFSVIPQRSGNVHRPLTEIDKKNINRIFSVQSNRKVNNDFTVQFKNNWYQLKEIQPTTVRPRETVVMEEWLDGSLKISLKGYSLDYFQLPDRPKRMKTNPVILTTHKLNWIPPKDHPWRRFTI